MWAVQIHRPAMSLELLLMAVGEALRRVEEFSLADAAGRARSQLRRGRRHLTLFTGRHAACEVIVTRLGLAGLSAWTCPVARTNCAARNARLLRDGRNPVFVPGCGGPAARGLRDAAALVLARVARRDGRWRRAVRRCAAASLRELRASISALLLRVGAAGAAGEAETKATDAEAEEKGFEPARAPDSDRVLAGGANRWEALAGAAGAALCLSPATALAPGARALHVPTGQLVTVVAAAEGARSCVVAPDRAIASAVLLHRCAPFPEGQIGRAHV